MKDIITLNRIAKLYWQDKTRGVDPFTRWVDRAIRLEGPDGDVARSAAAGNNLWKRLATDRMLRGGWRYEASSDVFGSIWICEGQYPILNPHHKCYRYSQATKQFSYWENTIDKPIMIGSKNKSEIDFTWLEPCSINKVDPEALVVGMYSDITGSKNDN
jgi:hypothetical protein